MTKTIDRARATFVARFGEEQAAAIEDAGRSHLTKDQWPVHSDDGFGSQPFRYWFLLCIGYDCLTSFRDDHGITADLEEMRTWALNQDEGNIAAHDGDVPDYRALIAGRYNDWVSTDTEGAPSP